MIALNTVVLCAFVNIAASQTTNVCSGENENLSCVITKDCPWFQKHLMIYKQIPKDSAEKKEKLAELKSKVCSKGKPRKVCCPEEITTTTTTPPTTTTQTPERPGTNVPNTSPRWLPSGDKGECGLDLYSEFIFGGNITKMGEHPWAVLVGKPSRNGRQTKWHCGGTLINRWYVVSAAHCSPSQITMVRLGEWKVVDTSKPLRRKGLKFSPTQRCRRCANFRLVNGTYDCIDRSTNEFVWPEDTGATNAECAPPHQDIEVAEVIVHPNYNRLKSGLVINDIVLIKLQRPVELNDYVQPACLPMTLHSPDLLQDLGEQQTPLKPVVIGWGKSYDEDYNETATVASAFQQKLELPLVKNRDCSGIWSEFFKRNLTGDITVQHFICAGGEKGKDSCSGDSGGPLVIRESDADPTYLVGVVSAGTSRCGIGAPAIFTRVTSMLSWILDSIN